MSGFVVELANEVFKNNTTLTMLTYLMCMLTLYFNLAEIISFMWDTSIYFRNF